MRHIGDVQTPAHAIHLVELYQHQVNVCPHGRRELHHIIALSHVINQLIIVNDQVRSKRICLILMLESMIIFLKRRTSTARSSLVPIAVQL